MCKLRKLGDEVHAAMTIAMILTVFSRLFSEPLSLLEFSNNTFTLDGFYDSVYGAMSEDGVLVTSVGDVRFFGTTHPSMHDTQAIEKQQRILQNAGFKTATQGFLQPFNLHLSSKGQTTSSNLLVDEATVEVAIRQRLVPTVSGESPLRFLDGSTMFSFANVVDASSMNTRRSLCTCEPNGEVLSKPCHCQSPEELLFNVDKFVDATTSKKLTSVPGYEAADADTATKGGVCDAELASTDEARVMQAHYS